MTVRGDLCRVLAMISCSGDLLVTEVGRGGVTELVEVEAAGVLVGQDPGTVVAQAATAGVRAGVTGRGPAGGDWPTAGQEQRAGGA
jgi:hypothetical protein